MTVDIEFIMSTLWSQITPLVCPTTGLPSASQPFAFGSRRLNLSAGIPQTNMPAVYLHQPKIGSARASDHVPATMEVKANIWIFTNAGLDPAVYPITALNGLVQAILNLFASNNPTQNTFNIPGTQARLRIDGDIITDDGATDGQGLALIPLKILIPNF
jgi:hypothetical protein